MVPEEGFEDLYENAPCGYLSMHADGRIFRVNTTLAWWLGLGKEALIGRRFRDLLTIPGRILYETQLAPLLQTATPFEEVMADLSTHAGEKIAVIMNGVQQRDPRSGEVYCRLTLMKVLDRRRYERDLIASRDEAEAQNELSHAREIAAGDLLADAREASALREQFIAVLGHDLRNPLASVVGAARLLRKQPQSEKSLLFIGLMETSVQRIADLIDNVLDFARGRLGGGLTVNRDEKGLLEPIIQQVVEELRSSVPERLIEVDVVLAEPADFDPVRIGQLISEAYTGHAVAA